MELNHWHKWACPVIGHTNVTKTFEHVFFDTFKYPVGMYVIYVGTIRGKLVQIMEFWTGDSCRDAKLTYEDGHTITYIAGVDKVIKYYPPKYKYTQDDYEAIEQ